ncbi:MAG: hypothetical protein IJ087_15170 [Eggerthellaceae bacterium]|nr:hypothetical protein [Eggerthellaceae bacterium]
MGLAEVTGLYEMPIGLRFAFYLVDNVLIAILVGVAVYLVQRRIDVWRERSARRVASDQFVAEKIQPLMDAINENIPLLGSLAARAGNLTEQDRCAFGDCHERQVSEVERLRTAREFNEAAFEPYRDEIDAVISAMDELGRLVSSARITGADPDPEDYLKLQEALRNASKALSNKSSVAVHAH